MVGALGEEAAVLVDQVLPFHTLSVHLRDGSGESGESGDSGDSGESDASGERGDSGE